MIFGDFDSHFFFVAEKRILYGNLGVHNTSTGAFTVFHVLFVDLVFVLSRRRFHSSSHVLSRDKQDCLFWY